MRIFAFLQHPLWDAEFQNDLLSWDYLLYLYFQSWVSTRRCKSSMFCAHLLPCTTVIGWMKCFSFLWKDWFVGTQGIHHCIEKQQSWLFLVCVCLVTQSRQTLRDPMDCSSPGSSVHGHSLGKNTRGGCHALLHGIFPIQGSNPGLPHCRQILYCLSHQGSPGNTL